MDCLANIIGLSVTGCDCVELNPSDESLSGLYLDDTTEGRLPLSATIFDCSDNDAVTFLNRLVPDAVSELNNLLYMEFEKQLVRKYKDYNFKLPRKLSYSSQLAATSGYYFACYKPKVIRGNNMTIKTVSIKGHTGNIKLIDEFDEILFDDVIAAWSEITLPMDRTYFIAYQSSTRPNDIKYKCGSCSSSEQYENFMTAGGGIVDDLANLEFTTSEYSYGIQIDAHLDCDPLAPLCDLDYLTNGWGRVYAYAVLNIARKNLAAWLVSSGQITNYITTNGEELPILIELYNKNIQERIKFLPAAYNLTDCYQCGYISKGQILI